MMKLKYLGLFLFIIISACKKENEVDLSDFDVKTDAVTFKIGEEVTFNLSGTTSLLSFYSGEVGNEYEYRNQPRIDELEKLMFIFQTHNTPTEAVQYKLMVSTDFNGVYTYENVAAATWTDLSSRFQWAPPAPWQTLWLSSGAVDISDVFVKGKPLFIAFRYVAPAVPAGTIPGRNWRTSSHALSIETEFGYTSSLANFATMGWKLVKKDATLTSSSVVSSSILLLAATANYRSEYEEWGISKSFVIDNVDLGVDRSVPIKAYSDLQLKEYKHVYSKEGKYRATFVAASKTANSDKQIIKNVDITVVP